MVMGDVGTGTEVDTVSANAACTFAIGPSTGTITVTAGTTCSNGTAVPNVAPNPGLVSDCDALLGAQDALKGMEALN